jgi:hypothetical protein
MKGVYFALRFAEFRCRREAFADGLSIDLAGQTEVGVHAPVGRVDDNGS